MAKYAKLNKLRFGQLLVLILDQHFPPEWDTGNLHYVEDKDLEKAFKLLYVSKLPTKDRGGYYPHGHTPKPQ